MKKKRKIKKKFIVLIVIAVILLIAIIGLIVFKNFSKNTDTSAKVVEEITEYGYYLEDDQPKVYKNLFKELVKVLNEEKVNEEEYAKLISQMAAIDFYNLDNKVSKNDVGAVQFVREKNIDNFVLEASETVYKYVEQNIYGDRKQELPIVTDSEVIDIKQESYKYKNIKDDKAYIIKVGLDYKQDLGYPEEVEIKLLHTDKKLEIYAMK